MTNDQLRELGVAALGQLSKLRGDLGATTMIAEWIMNARHTLLKEPISETDVVISAEAYEHLSRLLDEAKSVYYAADVAGVSVRPDHYRRINRGRRLLKQAKNSDLVIHDEERDSYDVRTS